MTRILLLLCAGALAVACSGTPGASTNALPSDLGNAALTQVCDSTSQTSLAGVADQLRSVDSTSDPTQVVASVDTLISTLQGLDVSSAAQALRDTAVNQLRTARSALSDPATASQAATSAAGALDGLDAALCQ